MPVPAIVAGAAAVAGRVAAKKAAKEVAKKATLIAKSAKGAKKENEKIATEVIQSRSVRTRPADKAARKARNAESTSKTIKAKTGKAAKEGAKKAEKFYKDSSPYLGNQTVRVKSGNAEPYKITGGAGSTARRTGEVIKRANKKGKK